MLSEFIDKIAALAKASVATDIISTPIPNRLLLRKGSGESEWLDVPPRERAYTIDSYDDFALLVMEPEICPAPEILHDYSRIAVVPDRVRRDSMITMHLEQTERFKTIVGLGTGRAFTPAEAVRFLRFDLPGIGAQDLIPALQRIDFKRTGVSVGAAKHGAETLGRTVEAAVQQADLVPTNFVVEVPVYRNAGLSGVAPEVECGIYLDVMNERIVIRPLADEISDAINSAVSEIHAMLVRDLPGVPCFRGANWSHAVR